MCRLLSDRKDGLETTAVLEPKGSYSYPLEPGTFLKKPEITTFADADMRPGVYVVPYVPGEWIMRPRAFPKVLIYIKLSKIPTGQKHKSRRYCKSENKY